MQDGILQLQFGSEIFDLSSIGTMEGSALVSDGGGEWGFAPHRLDSVLQSEALQLTEERLQVAFYGVRGPDIRRMLARLWRILRAAWRYTFTSRQDVPVYIIFMPKSGTAPQYALLHSSPQVSGPSPIGTVNIDRFFRVLLEEGLTLLHFPWQDGPPGDLPTSAKMLTASDGPADPMLVHVANHRDTAQVTHIYNWDFSRDALVLNPGFETPGGGGADIWANWGEFAGDGALANETVLIHSGSDACKQTSGPTSNTGIWTDAIAVSALTPYRLSLWARGDGTNQGRVRVWDNTNLAWITASTPTGIPGTTYGQFTQAFTTPAGCISILIYLLCPLVNGGIAYFDDVSLAFSQNLVAEAAWSILSNDAGDAIYFGNGDATPRPWHHLILNIGTAGVYTADIICEYWNGAWVTLPEGPASGAAHTLYPTGNEDEIFKSLGDWAINVGAMSDWATTTVNGVAGYWVRLRIVAVTVWTTTPVTSAQLPYTQRSPHISIPADTFAGDTFPLAMLRMRTPYGGDDDEGFPNLSKIIVGMKSRNLDAFVSHLDCGDAGNPAGWATALGTDATYVTDTLAPMGRAVNVSFATDTALVNRLTITGTAKLASSIGSYRLLLRAQQLAGAAGDCQAAVYTRLRSTAVSDPATRTETVSLGTFSAGLELIDLGMLTIPFVPVADADEWTNVDLIFQIYVQRSAGAATLRLYDLILIPDDEWAAEYTDPFGDTAYGSDALRGNNALDVDPGLIRPRVMKSYVSGGEFQPMATWRNGGPWPRIPPAETSRLFFVMGHIKAGGTWAVGPWISTLGQQLAVELYGRDRYLHLRP